MDETWDELLVKQHGIFTVLQARAHGLSRDLLGARVGGRLYRKVAPGTMYVGGPLPLPPAARLWRAVLSPDEAVVSHTTAARLWDLRLPAGDDIHVTIPRELWRPRWEVAIHTTKTRLTMDLSTRCDLPVTTVERSLIDAFGILEAASSRRTLVAEAVRVEATSVQALSDCIDRMEKVRRRAELVRVIVLTAGGSQSAGEMKLYEFALRWSLPQPERQYIARLPNGPRFVDLALPAYKIAVEYDGRHHLVDEQQYADQLRDEALRRLHWVTVRVSERRLLDEPRLAADIWANMREQAERFGLEPPAAPHL